LEGGGVKMPLRLSKEEKGEENVGNNVSSEDIGTSWGLPP